MAHHICGPHRAREAVAEVFLHLCNESDGTDGAGVSLRGILVEVSVHDHLDHFDSIGPSKRGRRNSPQLPWGFSRSARIRRHEELTHRYDTLHPQAAVNPGS
jgi:hypothetical protein